MVDQCSVWAYEDIKETGRLGRLQGMFLAVYCAAQRPLTAYQAFQEFKKIFGEYPQKSLHGMGSRITELEAFGFLEKIGVVQCEYTHKKVNQWRYTGRKTPKIKSIKRVCCPRCNGKGVVDVYEYLDL